MQPYLIKTSAKRSLEFPRSTFKTTTQYKVIFDFMNEFYQTFPTAEYLKNGILRTPYKFCIIR